MPFKNKIMPQTPSHHPSDQVPSQESSSERASRFYKEGQAAAEKVRKKWGDSFMKIMNKKEEEFKKKERLLQGVIVFLCILCVILFVNMVNANFSVQATKHEENRPEFTPL